MRRTGKRRESQLICVWINTAYYIHRIDINDVEDQGYVQNKEKNV